MRLRPGPDGKPQANPRLVTPLLDGLPAERATRLVLDTLSATDIHERSKAMLASRAAARPETGVLVELRQAIESGGVSPRVARSVAMSSVNNRPFSKMEKGMRVAIRAGDFAAAQQISGSYAIRLEEARQTIAAARAMGAKIPAEVDKRAGIQRDRLNRRLAELKRAQAKAANAAAAAAAAAAKG